MKHPEHSADSHSWYITAFELLPDELAAELDTSLGDPAWTAGVDWPLVQDATDRLSLADLRKIHADFEGMRLARLAAFYRRAIVSRGETP